MEIIVFEVGPFLENTYLLLKGREALLIDPGFADQSEYASFKKTLERHSAGLSAVMLTHAHVDHVLGLQRVLDDFEIKVYLNIGDLFLWENFADQARMFGLNAAGFSFIPESLPATGYLKIGNFSIRCLHTPGHSPDHTSFYFEDEGVLLAGDAVFRESIGRTDLYKGDFSLLEKSIKEKIYTLPEETVIYPGHGPATDVRHEKKYNPFVRLD